MQKLTTSKPTYLLKAMASRGITNERAPDHVVRARHVSCFGRLPLTQLQLKPPCPALRSTDAGGHYCSDCGCGDGRGVLLDIPEDPAHYSKLHYPWLSCPRKQEGFSNYEPPCSLQSTPAPAE